jgi:nucleotide-binding universal stress UspA family protein
MFKKILVPVDLAEPDMASPALAEARELAQRSGGAIRLLNVQSLMPATFMDYVPAGFDEEQRDRAETALAQLAADLPAELSATSVVRVGGVYPEVLSEADEWGADLIVIGSHRPAMSTFLMGSNAKTVVRHAKCSVLVVRR